VIAALTAVETPWYARLISLAGLGVMVALAYALSVDRGNVRWRPVVWAVALQLALGLAILNPALQSFFFDVVDVAIRRLLSFAEAGASFVFQSVEPHQILGPDGRAETIIGRISPPVKTFAFWILPTIVFFSSLMAVLYHLGVMQRVVWALAWLMQRTLKTSGAESLSTAADIFLGQAESPLTVRPYVPNMTRSELNAVMTAGFATVAGGVMAAYVAFLREVPGIAGHLATASILAAPASLAIAKIVVPETDRPETSGRLDLDLTSPHRNVIEAAAGGATDGAKLAINVGAMLIAFVGLVALIDALLGVISLGGEPLSLSRAFGWIFAPLAWCMGVPGSEAPLVGRLLGEKLVLTELIAYLHLGELTRSSVPVLSERSAVIASYALCGFANFASVGVQIGAIGTIAPKRTGDVAALGLRAMLGGSLATFMTACIAGFLF
jgi:concentrative nucleoside transporter, CNT family